MKRPTWIRTKHSHFWIIYWSPHSFLANHLPPFHNLTSQFIQHMRDRTKIFGHESTPSFGIISPSSQSFPHTLSAHDSRFMNIKTKGTPTSDLSQPACGLAPRSLIAVNTITLPPSGSPASTAMPLRRAGEAHCHTRRPVFRDRFTYAWWSRRRSVVRWTHSCAHGLSTVRFHALALHAIKSRFQFHVHLMLPQTRSRCCSPTLSTPLAVAYRQQRSHFPHAAHPLSICLSTLLST